MDCDLLRQLRTFAWTARDMPISCWLTMYTITSQHSVAALTLLSLAIALKLKPAIRLVIAYAGTRRASVLLQVSVETARSFNGQIERLSIPSIFFERSPRATIVRGVAVGLTIVRTGRHFPSLSSPSPHLASPHLPTSLPPPTHNLRTNIAQAL